MDVITGWNGDYQYSFSGNNFTTWTRNMLLEWHHNDPVSQKEIDRNDAIYYEYQHNRNPFIDNPVYADAIWDPNYNPSYINITEAYFTVYPNPAKSNISIEANFDSEQKIITIQDICGRTIIESSFNNNININIESLNSGTYFINIISKDGKRFIKQVIIY